MRKPSMLVTVFAAAVVAVLSAMGACSSADGVTPDCQFNVGGNGIVPKANGCEGFAPCLDKNGKNQPAAACCVDDMGAALIGDTLAICLYGYGVGALPTTTSSSSGGTGGSTSSSGGTGGSTSSSGGTGGGADGGA